MTTMDNITHRELVDSLALREGSPCLKCLVRPTCTKSMTTKSACIEYARFLEKLVQRAKNESKT